MYNGTYAQYSIKNLHTEALACSCLLSRVRARSLAHKHTHTHTHTHSDGPPCHPRQCHDSLSLSLSHTHTHTHSLPPLTSLPPFLSLSFPLQPLLYFTHSLTLSRTHRAPRQILQSHVTWSATLQDRLCCPERAPARERKKARARASEKTRERERKRERDRERERERERE